MAVMRGLHAAMVNDPLPARTAGQAVGQGAQGFVKGLLDVPVVGGIIKGVANTIDWAGEDDRARAQIAGGQSGRLPVQQRVVLIRQLLSGSCGDEDEQAITRIFRESTADEMVQMADAVDIETLYSKIDGKELDVFIRTVRPMFRRWTEARSEAGELQRIIDRFGVSKLRDELGDHKARLNALLSRAGRS